MTRSISFCSAVCVCAIGVHVRRFNARRLSVRWVRKLHEIGFIYVFLFWLKHGIKPLFFLSCHIYMQPNGTNCGFKRRHAFTEAASNQRKWRFAWAEMQFMIKHKNHVRMRLRTIAGPHHQKHIQAVQAFQELKNKWKLVCDILTGPLHKVDQDVVFLHFRNYPMNKLKPVRMRRMPSLCKKEFLVIQARE